MFLAVRNKPFLAKNYEKNFVLWRDNTGYYVSHFYLTTTFKLKYSTADKIFYSQDKTKSNSIIPSAKNNIISSTEQDAQLHSQDQLCTRTL